MTEIDMQNIEDFYMGEQNERNEEDIVENEVDYICENPPFSNFDEHYLDDPDIDDQMWKDMQELFEEGQEKENQETFDVENFINNWERQDDKYHDGKND